MANFLTDTLGCLALLGCTLPTVAAPVVLQDQGPTRPIQEYGIPHIELPRQPLPLPAKTGGPAIAPSFPVRTPGLTMGALTPVTVNLPQLAGRPIFIIGSDAVSRNWLARHQSRLTQINAIGILTQAEGPEDFNAMKSLAGNLPLTAINAQELAQILGLGHYPALVSSQRIEQ